MKKLLLLIPLFFVLVVLTGCQGNLGMRTSNYFNQDDGYIYPISNNSIINGGEVLASSSKNSDVLTASQICSYSVISITPLNSDINETLPASSTLASACLDVVGKSVEFTFENATTDATTTTIVAGAGITIASSSGVVIGKGGWAEIKIKRVREAGDEFVAIIKTFIK